MIQFLEALGTTYPLLQCNIPEDMNLHFLVVVSGLVHTDQSDIKHCNFVMYKEPTRCNFGQYCFLLTTASTLYMCWVQKVPETCRVYLQLFIKNIAAQSCISLVLYML